MAANQKIDKSNLGYLGSDYQYQLVKCFMEERGYFQSIYNIVEQNTFTEPLLKQYVGNLKDYYRENGTVPTYNTMLIHLKSKARMTIEIQEWEDLTKKLKEIGTDGNIVVMDNATKFFKQQNMIKVAKTILQMTEDGDTDRYDECVGMVEEAINIGKQDDEAFNPYDLLNEAVSKDYKCPVPTGISKLDDCLNGGLEKRKLGVIIGSAGFGKALWNEEVVVTPFGYKKIKDIKEGEYVYGTDGKPTKVLGVYPQGVRAIYKVKFSNGSVVCCDLKHLWTVRKNGRCKWETFTLEEIKDGLNDNTYMLPKVKKCQFNGINPFIGERIASNKERIYIEKVQYFKADEATCIMVDSKDHLYLTRDFIPTHNTTLTTAISSYASTYCAEINNYAGFKVLQFVFEDDKVDIARKHISRITQIEAKDVANESDIVIRKMETFDKKDVFRNNVRIIKLATNKETVTGIRNRIKEQINKGFKPDLITLDYFECIAFERGYGKNTTKWDMQEITMRSIENLAEEFDVALWVTTQGNKESFISDVVRMDQSGGSVSKVQIGHVIISIARSIDDQANNRATIALLKNRQGSSGAVFKDIKFNNGTSTISCDEVQDFDNMLAYEAEMNKKKQETQQRINQNFQPKQSPMPYDFDRDFNGSEDIFKTNKQPKKEPEPVYYAEKELPNELYEERWL